MTARRVALAGWVVPIAAYIVILGASGITTKLALRTIDWRQLVLWVPVCYAAIAIAFALKNGTRFPTGSGGFWAIVTAVCASSALVLFFYALTKGDASLVVPIGAAYPIVTLIGSSIFLSEQVTWPRIVGALMVVAGVFVMGRFG